MPFSTREAACSRRTALSRSRTLRSPPPGILRLRMASASYGPYSAPNDALCLARCYAADAAAAFLACADRFACRAGLTGCLGSAIGFTTTSINAF